MDPHAVKGYCKHIFKSAKLESFSSWWISEDHELGGKPEKICIEQPRLVVDRAEAICDLTSTIKT